VNIESGKQHAPLHVYWRAAEELGVEPASLIPTSSEMSANEQPVILDSDTVSEINEATMSDPKAREDLTNFIAKVRNRGSET